MPVTLRTRVVKSPAPSSTRRAKTSTKTSTKTSAGEEKNSTSPFFPRTFADRPITLPQPPGLSFLLRPATYGLIQERICDSLYALVVQSILWNQTRGRMARPVLFEVLSEYPTPLDLSMASLKDLTVMLQPIGLHNIRAARLIALAERWLVAPPCKERRYRKLHYPDRGCGADVKPGEVLGPDDEREGWEIAHLPGVGTYALDSYRIFYRDQLRGVETMDGVEPEWKKVAPTDKELKLYLEWKWQTSRRKSSNR